MPPGKTAKPISSPNLRTVKREQLDYLRQQNRNRLAVAIVAGLVGALIAFVGLVLFDVQAAVILTMLFIFSRISAPAMGMNQMLQQFAGAAPAHAEFLQLERDLAVHEAPEARSAPAIAPGSIATSVSTMTESAGQAAGSNASI